MDKQNDPMKKIDAPEKVIFICDGKKCGKCNKDVRKGFKGMIKECGLKDEVDIIDMECTDNCKTAPNICLQPQNLWIGEVTGKDVPDIFRKYFLTQ